MIINHIIIPLMGCLVIVGLAATIRNLYEAFKEDIGEQYAFAEREEEHWYQHQRIEANRPPPKAGSSNCS